MIKNLTKLANRLDSLGFTKEADSLDLIIMKLAHLFKKVKDDDQPYEYVEEGCLQGYESYDGSIEGEVCLTDEPDIDREKLYHMFMDRIGEVFENIYEHQDTIRHEWGPYEAPEINVYKVSFSLPDKENGSLYEYSMSFWPVTKKYFPGFTQSVEDRSGLMHYFYSEI